MALLLSMHVFRRYFEICISISIDSCIRKWSCSCKSFSSVEQGLGRSRSQFTFAVTIFLAMNSVPLLMGASIFSYSLSFVAQFFIAKVNRYVTKSRTDTIFSPENKLILAFSESNKIPATPIHVGHVVGTIIKPWSKKNTIHSTPGLGQRETKKN